MPPAYIDLAAARSESSASLALTTPANIPLQPARATSAAFLDLTTGATSSAYEGAAVVSIKPLTAAELHPHTETPPPWTLLDATPMLAVVAYVVMRERFTFHIRLTE